jgi:hypothetical protein
MLDKFSETRQLKCVDNFSKKISCYQAVSGADGRMDGWCGLISSP